MGAIDDLFADTGASQQAVMLAGATDFAGFRQHARRLLAANVAPAAVHWHTSDALITDLFADAPAASTAGPTGDNAAPLPTAPAASPLAVPPYFLALCQSVVLHSDAQRFGLLYRLLWRMSREPGLRHDPLDADRIQAGHLAQAVRRDMHKMKAFVRFRSIEDEAFRARPLEGPLHVAWFEPEHHIVEAVTPFFARRFTQMRWAILTPERSVRWDGARAHFGPGSKKDDAPPADAGEQLWLTYYQHIFNPARLKLKMMQKEMPRKYWHNLPEAQFISSLTASAHQRQLTMVNSAPQPPRRRIPVFQASAAAVGRAAANDQSALDGQPIAFASIKAMNAALQTCNNCPIGQHATQAVPGEGPATAALMVVGEQPGDFEDLHGRPFVGPAGQLFDRALTDLKQPRGELFITNAVKHFKYEPRGKQRIHKTPAQSEAAACRPWLESELALVKPHAVLALGATAAASLLGRHVAVMSERGQWFVRPDGLRVLVTLHPSALLRMPPNLQASAYAAWLQDLQKAFDGVVQAGTAADTVTSAVSAVNYS